MSVNIEGLNKADVLCALYNCSRPQGLGFLQYDASPMTREIAVELLKKPHFDYLKGRVIKISLESDIEFDEYGYDRDNGKGTAQIVINSLRVGNLLKIDKMHKEGVENAAAITMNYVKQPTRINGNHVILGLYEFEEQLTKAIKEAKKANS
jgi:hypothetical protein